MTTLHFKSAQVQNDYPTDDVIETIPVQLDPADLDWYHEHLCREHADTPAADDLDWLLNQLDWESGPIGAGRLISDAILESVAQLQYHGCRTIAAYGKPSYRSAYTRIRPSIGVLLSLHGRTKLARVLDTVAVWYASLETAAGDFAASAVQYHANHANMLGSKNYAEYGRDDARYEAEREIRAAEHAAEDESLQRHLEEAYRWGM